MIIQRLEPNHLYQPSDLERRFSQKPSPSCDARDEFERDYGRIVHSAAFRRLQAKTQVLGQNVGDIHRTRLTHSLEVAQIARGIGIFLNQHDPVLSPDYALDISLLEAAGLAHDLGHPPFGHRGEQALHECMQSYGGFEANAQTFRILTALEGKNQKGMNLTRGLLLSIMKYPILLDQAVGSDQDKAIPPKASIYSTEKEMFEWVLSPFTEEEREYLTAVEVDLQGRIKTKHKTLECSIIELADDIAYGTHDVEDAINLGFIGLQQLNELFEQFRHLYDHPHFCNTIKILNQLLKQGHHNKYLVKRVSSSLISTFVYSISIQKQEDHFTSPRCRYRAVLEPELRRLLDQLREIVFEHVIYSQKVQTVNWRGSYILKRLFSAIMEETMLLPENDRKKITAATSEEKRARIICDYLAGMTDSFALRMYERLYGHSRNFFDY